MRVVMLVRNDWKFDSRVTREAEALAEDGVDVDVLCRRDSMGVTVERHNGVRYHCLPYRNPAHWRQAIRAHLSVVSLNVKWLLRGPRRRIAASAVAEQLVALLPVAIGGVLLFVGLVAWRGIARRILHYKSLDVIVNRSVVIARLKSVVASVLRYVVQPVQHLNESVHSCMPTILALRPDAIHAHDVVTLSTGALAADRLGARLIYDSHELERHTNDHALNLWTKQWIRRYETDFAGRCDAVVTVSGSIADWLEREYRIARPVVVGNAPSLRTPSVARSGPIDTVRKRLRLDPSARVIVYVGSVTVDRGLEVCVRALKELAGVHFAVVGPRYDVTKTCMLEAAAEADAAERLHFVDPVPPADIMSFIADADCSVMAIQNICLSYYYCFPNKLLESVFAGLPVVVSDLLELRRFVTEYGVGVVVDQCNPRSIANGIRDVLADPGRYRPSVETLAAIDRAYGWDEQRRRLLDLYRGLRRGRVESGVRVYEPLSPHSAN
jgi:glycosyltransferase involved in cell wall biosynthesis